MSTQKNTQQYFTSCQSHDWFYSFSDDHNEYEQGRLAQKTLESSATDKTKTKILQAFKRHTAAVIAGNHDHPEPQLTDF